MAGIYIHIPFCTSKCSYCDFFSEAKINLIPKYVSALKKEIVFRKDYLANEKISTIYFGGGTPSVLSVAQINELIREIEENFKIENSPEITFEANPDDLTNDYLKTLKNKTAINRLSIGFQSFYDDDLKLMNRRHTAKQAIKVAEKVKKIGFKNISGDLIYGLPNQTTEKWNKNLDTFFKFDFQHLSAYHLTYEHGTKFWKLLHAGKISEATDEQSVSQFEILMEKADENQFFHYEISNFAKKDYQSKHNSSYWEGKKYLGLGSSAHSFNKKTRQWNVASIEKYIDAINSGKIPATGETLNQDNILNEYLITAMRTAKGVDLDFVRNEFNFKHINYLEKILENHRKNGFLTKNNANYSLTHAGKLISDSIILDLFVV